MSKITIVTTFTPSILPYLQYNIASVSSYCVQHEYEYRLYPSHMDKLEKPRAHHWSKIDAALSYIDSMKNDDWLFILDADTLIQQPHIKLEEFTKTAGKSIILVCDDSPNGGFVNTGAIFIKKTPETKNLLTLWWELAARLDKRTDLYHEQDVLVWMIKNFEHCMREDAVKIYAHDAFNSGHLELIKDTDFIAHLMALPLEERTSIMKARYEKLKLKEATQ